MQHNQASWTAEISAAFRAVESIRSDRERLFKDIYADKFLSPSFRLLLKNRLVAKFMLWLAVDRRFPGATDTVSARVRFVDDCLTDSMQNGMEQLVILGAGYDSRAYRFRNLIRKRVFEVDDPRTQALKKDKILKMFGLLPRHVTYVPVNFETDNLITQLTTAGYRPDCKTLFIWEAVSKYLTAEAVHAVLASVSANACKGSTIVFDYLFNSMVTGQINSRLAHKMLIFQAKKGEPYIFGLPEENPEQHIMAKGFSKVKNTTAEMIAATYFNPIKRGSKLHLFWGLIQATV